MPRPAKTIRRQKINAAIEYRKGNREQAYQLWDKAAAARKERLQAKHNKRKRAEAEAAAQQTESAEQ